MGYLQEYWIPLVGCIVLALLQEWGLMVLLVAVSIYFARVAAVQDYHRAANRVHQANVTVFFRVLAEKLGVSEEDVSRHAKGYEAALAPADLKTVRRDLEWAYTGVGFNAVKWSRQYDQETAKANRASWEEAFRRQAEEDARKAAEKPAPSQ